MSNKIAFIFWLRVVRSRSGMRDECLRNIILIECDMSAFDFWGLGQVSIDVDVAGDTVNSIGGCRCAITSSPQQCPSYPGFRVGKKRSNYSSRYESQGTWGVCCGAVDVIVVTPHAF